MRRSASLLLLLPVMLAACSFYDARAPAEGVELRMRAPDGASVDAIMETVDARLEPAGFRWRELKAGGPGEIVLRVGALDDTSGPALRRLATQPLRLRLYVLAPGVDPVTWVRTGEPVFDDSQVKHSFLEDHSKGTRLNLDLTREAGRKLLAATTPNGGGLVVFVDEERVMATLLDGPLRGGVIKLRPSGDTKEAVHLRAVELISALRGGPLAAPLTIESETGWTAAKK